MIQNKNQNIIYLDTNNLYGYAMSKFLLTGKLQWIDPKDFDLNSFKYKKNSSKCCVLEVDFEYPRELHELHNDHPLASDKIELKNEMSKYQLIAHLYKIPVA